MKKEYRLLKNQDFKEVLDKRKHVSRENLKVYHKTNDLDHCRIGVSVSSKIGNSVVRHKIKRQVVSMLDILLKLDNISAIHYRAEDYAIKNRECFDVVVARAVAKLNTLSGYTISFESHNPDVLDNHGRIITNPRYTTSVSYTVTVKNNTTGVEETATYSSIVKGIYA